MPAGEGAARRAASGGARPCDSRRFHRLVQHLHGLGPRPVGEVLLRLVPDRGALIRELERYGCLTPAFVRAAGGDDWLEPHALIRLARNIKGGRRPW
jgi:hypothetical protein